MFRPGRLAGSCGYAGFPAYTSFIVPAAFAVHGGRRTGVCLGMENGIRPVRLILAGVAYQLC